MDRNLLKQFAEIYRKLPLNLTQDELDFLYNEGAKHFRVNDLTKALAIFQLLTNYDASNPLYLKSLASCFQGLKDFFNATVNYQLAYMLDQQTHSDCLFYAGVCLFELEKYKQAAKSFRDYLATNWQEPNLSERAKLYLTAIERKGTS